jgi:hypothetical protein
MSLRALRNFHTPNTILFKIVVAKSYVLALTVQKKADG